MPRRKRHVARTPTRPAHRLPSSTPVSATIGSRNFGLEPIVAEATARARREGVTGPAVTPAVLALGEELSDGRSGEGNQRLIADNATLAPEDAVACAGRAPAEPPPARPRGRPPRAAPHGT